MDYFVGIDLGTTYSAAAVWRDGQAQMASLGNRRPEVPTVLLLRGSGPGSDGVLVGEAAASRAVEEPERLVREFKRRLGDPTPLLVAGAAHRAEELTAVMLRWIAARVAEAEGGPATGVVVTFPANWTGYKQGLLQEAIERAGLGHAGHAGHAAQVGLLREPEAAAIHYARDRDLPPGTTVAVYDLGGGTFDAAVLRRDFAGWDLLGEPEGIERLGGIDFDEAVYHHVVGSLDTGIDRLDPDDPVAMAALARLRQDCIVAKEALSTESEVTIPVILPSLRANVHLSRDELEAMIRPAVDESVSALQRALDGANVEVEALTAVLLVGGSSRVPLVERTVRAVLGCPVVMAGHPKHAVALGAATLAAHGAAVTPARSARPAAMAPVPIAGLAHQQPSIPSIPPAPPAGSAPPPSPAGSPPAPERTGRRRWPYGLVLAGVVAAVAGAVALILAPTRSAQVLPQAEPGHIEVLRDSFSDSDEELDSAEDGRLIGRTFDLEIVRYGHPDAVPLGVSATQQTAATSERWLVFEVRGSFPRVEFYDQRPTTHLIVGDDRIPLDDLPMRVVTEGNAVVVASVPETADVLALAVAEAGLEQSWSFVTGRRSDGAPAVLYRDEALSEQLDLQLTLPYAVDDSSPDDGRAGSGDAAFGEREASIAIGSIHMGYSFNDPNVGEHHASSPDRALLWLLGTTVRMGDDAYTAPVENMVLTAADGTTFTPTQLGNRFSEPLLGWPMWEVPADLTAGTITITPGSGLDVYDSGRVIDFGAGVIETEFSFGE